MGAFPPSIKGRTFILRHLPEQCPWFTKKFKKKEEERKGQVGSDGLTLRTEHEMLKRCTRTIQTLLSYRKST